jgi:undecaprenyl-diphosphatase
MNALSEMEVRGTSHFRSTAALLSPALVGLIVAALVLALADGFVLHWFRGDAVQFDTSVRALVHQESSPALTGACQIITRFGTWPVLPFLALAVFAFAWLCGEPGRAWFSLAAIGVASILLECAKQIVRRARPHAWFGHTPKTWSFPSGHALDSTACYLVFAVVLTAIVRSRLPRCIIFLLCLLLPLAIGYTRIYLGVHWPTDVLAGWLAGFSVAAGLIGSHRRLSVSRN